jgi:hypothetical protein
MLRISDLWTELSEAINKPPDREDILARRAIPPWESADERVTAAWLRLTSPENLNALFEWSAGKLNPHGRACTDKAIEVCRHRSKTNGESPSAMNSGKTLNSKRESPRKPSVRCHSPGPLVRKSEHRPSELTCSRLASRGLGRRVVSRYCAGEAFRGQWQVLLGASASGPRGVYLRRVVCATPTSGHGEAKLRAEVRGSGSPQTALHP